MSYPVKARCGNCGHMWTADVPKGHDRYSWSESAICPKCETKGHATTSTIS